MAADRIVVIDDGKVTEQGIHEELLNQNGRYADLWMKQLPANLVQKGKIIDTYERPRAPVSKVRVNLHPYPLCHLLIQTVREHRGESTPGQLSNNPWSSGGE